MKGSLEGKNFFSKTWSSYSVSLPNEKGADKSAYGAHWWLNRMVEGKKEFSSAPENMYYASGHHGQYMFIFPDQKMILVRLGLDNEEKMDANKMMNLLMKSLN